MNPPTEKTKKFWSDGFISNLYRKYAGRHFKKMHIFTAEQILKRDVKSLLDVACGPGDFLVYIKDQNPLLEVSGSDVAPGMVRHAKEKLGSVKILEADSENQPFEDNSFDAVSTMMAFHHFQNKAKVFQEIKRLLKDGGKYFIADVVAKSQTQKIFWNSLEKITGVRGPIAHYTEGEIRQIAEEAGFINIKSDSIPNMAKRYKLLSFQKSNK